MMRTTNHLKTVGDCMKVLDHLTVPEGVISIVATFDGSELAVSIINR